MKTKNILTLGILSVTLTMTSCKDSFLEVESHTNFPLEEFFTDEEHIDQALVAAYAPLHYPDWDGEQYNPVNIMSDIMADDIWPGGQSATDNQFWHLMMNYEALPNICMSGLWKDEYTGVKLCNDVLQYVEDAKDNLSTEAINRFTAEARLLRAYYYNTLWKFWGNIPYFEVNLEAPYFAEQLTADAVYENIISDLEEVLAMNALPMKSDEERLGHVTQAMGYMLYAEMVMYQNDNARYAKALDFMKLIIADPDYDLYAGTYADLWESEQEWCEESIFEINYTDDKSYRGWTGVEALFAGGTVLPRVISNPGGVGELGIDDGWGFAPVRTETYNMFSSLDERRDVSALDLRKYDYEPRYQNTGFWLGKYVAYSKNVERASGDKQLNYNNNLRVYRYSETLLNAAELLIRTGQDDGTGLAKDYLNEVRDRAGLAGWNKADLDNILEERHLEFVGEGKRYWDLVRTGKAATVLVPDSYGYRTNRWSTGKKYLPIPDVELSADPNHLKQNDAYFQ